MKYQLYLVCLYFRCIAAKGEGAPECDKFAKYYRSLCPGEWVCFVLYFAFARLDDVCMCMTMYILICSILHNVCVCMYMLLVVRVP